MTALLGTLFAFLSTIGFGSYPVVARNFIKKYGHESANLYMHTLGVFILSIFLLRPGIIEQALSILPLFLISGFIGAIGAYLLFYAFEIGNLATVLPLAQLGGFFSMILSIFLLGETLTRLQIVAAVLVLVGALFATINYGYLTQTNKKPRSNNIKKHTIFMSGAGIALAFSLVVSFYNVAASVLLSTVGTHHGTILLEFSVLMFLIIFGLGSLVKGKLNLRIDKTDIPTILIVGILFSIGAGMLYQAIKLVGLGLAGAIQQGAPIVGVILAAWLLKENPSFFQKIGIILVTSGLVLLSVFS